MADPNHAAVAAHLRRQLEHRYRALERSLTAGVTHDVALRVLGGRPPIAWHALHIGTAIRSTSAAVIGGAAIGGAGPADPTEDQAARLGTDLPLPTSAGAWSHERQRVLTDAGALLEALGTLEADELELPPKVPVMPAFQAALGTRRAFLEGHLYHVTYHTGALGLLRAEWGLA